MIDDSDIQQRIGAQEYKTVKNLEELLALYESGQVDNDHHIIFVLNWKDLSTFDNGLLTSLVILCHDRAIRCQISARSNKGIELMFHQRSRDGGISERHPTIEEAIQRVRVAQGM